jgi:uracil-DNA glycosylase
MVANVAQLNADIRNCRLCVERGFIEEATPIATAEYEWDSSISASACAGGRVMLIGQAPGQLEAVAREHFVGRAGRVLFRWLAAIGIAEEVFRRHVYMTAVTKCFPGRARGGDRRPSTEEVRLCRPFLDRQLAAVNPALVLLVGKMAIDLYLPGRALDELVGHVFEAEGRELLPLPHPSGMSRWLNATENQARLKEALELLKERLTLGDA